MTLTLATAWTTVRTKLSLVRKIPQRYVAILASLLLIQWVYIWFVSAGLLEHWPTYGFYHDWLADAFRAGQMHVLQPPHPELLKKANPYDPINGHLWIGDLSLYDGKYFLYWGPVPALFQAAAKALLKINQPVGEQYLTFAFVSLAGLCSALLVERMARRLFPRVPLVLVILAMGTVALANPIPHMLTTGVVYTVAITGGQAFLMLGLLAAFDAIWLGDGGKSARLRLVVAGFSWALAMGCRASVVPAVAVLVLLTGILATRPDKSNIKATFINTLAVGLPTAAAACALLWYNKARFDDWFEFGTNIQTGWFKFTFDLKYFGINTYTYFLRPFESSCHFPFIFQKWYPPATDLPSFVQVPEGYMFNEPVVGLLLGTPIIWLIPAAIGLAPFRGSWGDNKARSYFWCLGSFAALGTIPGLTPLGLYMATMRYLGDVVFGVVLLGILGLFALWQAGSTSRVLRVISVIATPTVAVTIMIGLALGYQGYNGHVHNLNPRFDRILRAQYSVCGNEYPPFPRFAPDGRTNETPAEKQKALRHARANRRKP